MVIILVAAMFIILIAISYWREVVVRKADEAKQAAKSEVKVSEHYYLHPSHTFARITPEGLVEVGMDEFAQHAFGEPDALELPAINQKVRQGDLAWRATVAGRKVTQRVPVDGKIVAVNQAGGDWILKIKPTRLQQNLVNLIDSFSLVNWLKMARAKFLMQYSGSLVPAKADGGELIRGFARQLDDDQWHHFVQEFFNSEN